MDENGFDPAALADQAPGLIGLAIDPAHRPGVVANLEATARMAALVMAFPLPDTVEPAPVFRP